MKRDIHCHVLVAEMAKSAAHELYDSFMRDNRLMRAWREQHPGMGSKALEDAFVEKVWPKAIPVAKATLAHMLTTPIDEHLKSTIHEALVLDASLTRGRAKPIGVAPFHV